MASIGRLFLLAKALIQLIGHDEPPLRWAAVADAVETLEKKGKELIGQTNAYREFSSSLAIDEGKVSTHQD